MNVLPRPEYERRMTIIDKFVKGEYTRKQCAQLLYITESALNSYMTRYRIYKFKHQNLVYATDKESDKRMEFYRQGLSDGEIAKQCRVRRSTIWHCRQKLGLPANFEKASGKAVAP